MLPKSLSQKRNIVRKPEKERMSKGRWEGRRRREGRGKEKRSKGGREGLPFLKLIAKEPQISS